MSRDKQIEEMAKVVCEDCAKDTSPCWMAKEGRMCDSVMEQAEALYNAGYRKQEWISVDERLPNRTGKYLVATFDGRVGIGNLIDYYCDGDLSFDNYKITHWMPLPEAPKMKGGAE